MVQGCFTIDTLLLSTLECYHSDSCISSHYKHINAVVEDGFDVIWFQSQPLVDDTTLTNFPSDTPLSDIVNRMMIEQWHPSFSFDHYYNACAPIYCAYSFPARTTSLIGIIIKLLSTIGGLTLALRLITPQLVKAVFSLARPKTRRTQKCNYCYTL